MKRFPVQRSGGAAPDSVRAHGRDCHGGALLVALLPQLERSASQPIYDLRLTEAIACRVSRDVHALHAARACQW